MTEPIYQYVKGQGWVVTNTNRRELVWNGKTWIIEMVDSVPRGQQSWLMSKRRPELLKMTSEELYCYAEEHWWGHDPGIQVNESSREPGNNVLYMFTPVNDV